MGKFLYSPKTISQSWSFILGINYTVVSLKTRPKLHCLQLASQGLYFGSGCLLQLGQFHCQTHIALDFDLILEERFLWVQFAGNQIYDITIVHDERHFRFIWNTRVEGKMLYWNYFVPGKDHNWVTKKSSSSKHKTSHIYLFVF